MDIYTEIHEKRAERAARRQRRIEEEERRQRILGPLKFLAQIVFGTILMFATLFAGTLWATM